MKVLMYRMLLSTKNFKKKSFCITQLLHVHDCLNMVKILLSLLYFLKKTGIDSEKIKRKGLIKSFNVLMFQVIPGGGGGGVGGELPVC